MVANMESYIKLSWEFFKRNLSGHMEYRTAFFVEVFGMVINNFAFVIVWVIFFAQFKQIKGWGLDEILLLNALAGMYYGLMVTFLGGYMRIGKLISEGGLDYFLSFPKDPLWHIGVSRMPASALGEILYGLITFTLCKYATPEGWAIYLLVGILSAIIFSQFIVLAHSLNFFFFNATEASQEIIWTTMSLSMAPQSVFEGGVKFIMLFIFPSLLIAGIPVDVIRNFNVQNVLILVGIAILITLLAQSVFRYGLKKYESGNQIQANM